MKSRPAASEQGETLAAQFAAAGLDWIVPAWSAPNSVHGFFTTRNDARSLITRASVASVHDGAQTDDVARLSIDDLTNRAQRFLPSPPLWLEQVHGADVLDVDAAATRPDELPRADAAVTRRIDRVLAVRVADCLAVLLSDRRGSVVAIAHAGWRGLAAGVVEKTVEAMACEPTQIVAWLGPAIGSAAFEVGDEVRDAFVAKTAAAMPAFVAGRPGKWHADLVSLARQRLADAGVRNVTADGRCTASQPERFHSFRRDRTTQRMAAFIWRSAA